MSENGLKLLQRARQGEYQEAIADLLEPHVWAGLTAADSQQWANEIWHILVLRTSRRYAPSPPHDAFFFCSCSRSGQERMHHEFLLPKRPPGTYHPREYWFGAGQGPQQVLGSLIRDPLFETLAAKVRASSSAPKA